MSFEWKLEKGKELTFEDKVHNLACFEIVINILRMKTRQETTMYQRRYVPYVVLL